MSGRRSYRMIRRRHRILLLNRQGELLTAVEDAFWTSVSQEDAQLVVSLNNESRTWKLPRSQCGEYRPVTQYQIRDQETNELWEIAGVPRETDALFHCVATRMNEHDYNIP